jgi:hypothetical protein
MNGMVHTTVFLRAAAALIFAFAFTACGGSSVGSGSSAAPVSSAPASVPTAASDPLVFSASNYSVAQNAGSVSLTVTRTGAATAAASVDYATIDGTAVGGTDYSTTGGTLNWAENDSSAKTIIVPVSNSTPYSGSKSFSVALAKPSASAEIATPDVATVTISGDATIGVGSLQFSASSYEVSQNASTITVTVNRTSGSSGAVSVSYTTSDGTAVAGTDYTAASGALSWADGDATSKTFLVAISNVTPFSGSKAFAIALSDPRAGATLGSIGAAAVTITGDASAPVGRLRLAASSSTVPQSAGALKMTVDRAAGTSGAVSVKYATNNGTAIAGADFTTATGTLHWADGDATSKTFAVAISNAKPFVGSKSFTVALSSPSGGASISSPAAATATIAGDASPPVGSLQLSASSYAVGQTAGTATVTVDRTGGSSGTVSAAYATASGTAVAGADFSTASGILQWADGDATPKTFSVAISKATAFAGTKSFTVTLSSPSGGATIGSPSSALVAITGDAATAVGSLQLSSSSYATAQGAGSLTVTVNRTGGSSGAVSAAYATANGTAAAGTDFTAANGTLSWADGDAKSKTFSVPISNATPFSGTKSFTVALSNPSGGAALSTPSGAGVVITGDAKTAVGTVVLAASSYTVAQSAGTLTLTVNRTGGSTGAISVTHAATDGTAVAGTDFTASSGTLQWGDGDGTPKTFTVTISNSVPFSGSKTFTVALSNAGGGAAIGTPSNAGISIAGSGSSGSGGSAPSAPTGLLMTGQGATSISLSWGAATPGNSPVSYYKIYRNGASYATASGTSYTDNAAINATNVLLDAPATIYSYAVSAVDSQGGEGVKATQVAAEMYYNGVFYWAGDYSYGTVINYRDTAGAPESGAYDIAVQVTGQGGGFQPYAGSVVPLYDLEAGSFGYIMLDLKPTISGQAWRLSAISRLPPGDVYPWAAVNLASYGPAPVAGKWATYKVPLSALSLGMTSFVGSISGTTLTVSSVASGVGVDAGGFITGPGVKPGTYITGHNANGGPGTYTIYPSQTVSSTTMTEQRTGVYKIDIIDDSGAFGNLYYVDNVKFVSN